MTPTETAALCKKLKALDQMMSIDDDTLAAWHAALGQYPAGQCWDAAVRVAQARRLQSGNRDTSALDPFDVRVEVRRIRQAHLDRVQVPCPNVDPADALGYRDELQAIKHAIMDGRMTPEGAALYDAGGWRITPGPKHREVESGSGVQVSKALLGRVVKHADEVGS